jgi:ABC-type polysaccharide/polyol phosphate export permease
LSFTLSGLPGILSAAERHPAQGGDGVTAYFSAIWQCRYFWLSLVKMDLRTRYRRSLLGIGWSLLNPIAMTAIFCFVFSKVFGGGDIASYAPFLLAGLSCWQYLTGVCLQGCQSFYRGESYIRQYPAPLAIYPLRIALGCMVHFLLAMAVVLVLAWGLRGFGNLRVIWSLVPSLTLLFVFGWSLALLVGFATVYFHDTQHLMEIGFQILFYATPVMYPAQMLRGTGLAWLVHVNPMLPFLDLIRVPILDNRLPPLVTLATATVLTLGTALAAGVVLNRLGKRLIFHL